MLEAKGRGDEGSRGSELPSEEEFDDASEDDDDGEDLQIGFVVLVAGARGQRDRGHEGDDERDDPEENAKGVLDAQLPRTAFERPPASHGRRHEPTAPAFQDRSP